MNPIIALVFSLLTASALLAGAADVVSLKNGDRISGDVTRMEDGDLKIETPYAGKIVIQWSEVSHLEMDEAVGVLLEDDTLTEVDQFSRDLDGLGENSPGVIDLDEAKIINPNPIDLGEKGEFKGKVNLAAKFESGTTNKDEIDVDYEMSYKRGKHRYRSLGQLEYDRSDDINSKRDWLLLSNYDYFMTERSYASVWFGLKQEYFEGLDLRTLTGLTYGHQFFEGEPTSLQSELGVFYVDENFSTTPDNEFVGPGWFVDFNRKVFDGDLRFYHKHYTIMSGSDTSKVLWHSWTGLSVPLFDHFVGSLEFEADYDSQPALRAHDLDKTVRLKIGYEW
jgi:putative salt-induced outer membrane protein YdiY